jgi:hypothetical protein
MILLPQPPECWDCRWEAPHLAQALSFIWCWGSKNTLQKVILHLLLWVILRISKRAIVIDIFIPLPYRSRLVSKKTSV